MVIFPLKDLLLEESRNIVGITVRNYLATKKYFMWGALIILYFRKREAFI